MKQHISVEKILCLVCASFLVGFSGALLYFLHTGMNKLGATVAAVVVGVVVAFFLTQMWDIAQEQKGRRLAGLRGVLVLTIPACVVLLVIWIERPGGFTLLDCERFTEITAKRLTDSPYLRGRVVAVRWGVDTANVDSAVQDALPKYLRAKQAAEVGTVVLTRRFEEKERVGTYVQPDGTPVGPGIKECFQVTIVDMSVRAIISQRDFCNSPPAWAFTPNGVEPKGADPLPDALVYLLALPRR